MIVLRILVASLVAWLSLGSPAEASPLTDAPVAVYTYGAPVHNAPGTASARERGPPGAGYADTTHDAVDRWSHGPSARPAGAMPSATHTTYDHPVLAVQVASATSMTLGWVRQAGDGPEVWGVRDADGSFSWRLKLKPEASTRPGLEAGSKVPRFDARIGPGEYVNPFTGELGGRGAGTHLPLEYQWIP